MIRKVYFKTKVDHNGCEYVPGIGYRVTRELEVILKNKEVEQLNLKKDGNNRNNKRDGHSTVFGRKRDRGKHKRLNELDSEHDRNN